MKEIIHRIVEKLLAREISKSEAIKELILLQNINVSEDIECIELKSTGTKAYFENGMFVSKNRQFVINFESAYQRKDMEIHYKP